MFPSACQRPSDYSKTDAVIIPDSLPSPLLPPSPFSALTFRDFISGIELATTFCPSRAGLCSVLGVLMRPKLRPSILLVFADRFEVYLSYFTDISAIFCDWQLVISILPSFHTLVLRFTAKTTKFYA
jgi:hypothetical protein